jgi:hypothetical protein
MAITELYTGTEAVTGTEWSLTGDDNSLDAITTDGVYQAFFDLNALTWGDIFRFRVYEKARGADTQRIVFEAFYAHDQSNDLNASPALVLMNGWDMSLFKVAGTDRTITWSIRQVG